MLLHSRFTLRYLKPPFKQVLYSFSHFPLILSYPQFSPITSLADPSSSSPSPSLSKQSHNSQLDLSSLDFRGIARSVLSKCSFAENKVKDYANASLKDLLLELSDIIPGITRRFWRVSVLEPENVLEILRGFQSKSVRDGIRVEKVRCLWEIFKRADEQNRGFNYLSQSYEVMASMLVQATLLREAEHLLSALEGRGISLDCHEVFNNLVEGYVGTREFKRAILVYNCMRNRGVILSRSCYCDLLDVLVQMKRIKLAFRISLDLVDLGLPLSVAETNTLEDVMRLLCSKGKILEARKLVKKVLPLNCEVSDLILDEIAIGYCEKKGFKDLLSFFIEVKRAPTVMATNRVMNSICISYGVERAAMFMLELQEIGFNPDEVTYGILIGWSCWEGKLKNALSYLSVMLSKSFSPLIYTYNALISGLFKVGMLKHVRDILDEMMDRGTIPDMSTFRVLLAGYCKVKLFDEAKRLICEMESRGLIKLSLKEDPLSKVFLILGLNPLTVRLKRDNDVGFSKTEFFDNIGNGLYLDTDLDEYEKHINWVLKDSTVPNFSRSVRNECINNNLKNVLILVEEMHRWGQEFLLPDFSELVRRLCSSRSHINLVTKILEKMPWLAHKLDQETFNLVVQGYSRKGLLYNAKFILEGMLQSQFHVKNETYTALLKCLCKKGNVRDFHNYWDVARRDKWLPGLVDFKYLLTHLCHRKLLGEALQSLELMLFSYPDQRLDICHMFLEIVSSTGFAGIALVFLEHLQHYYVLDHAGCNNLLGGLCNEGKFSVAFTVLNDMLDKNLAPCLNASVLLINQLCKADRYDKAIALKDIILKQHPAFASSANRALICGFCGTGNIEKADTLFQNLLSEGLILDAEISDILIQGHCRANDLRKVGELLGVVIRKNLEFPLSSYRSMVRMMCMTGRVPVTLSLKNLMLVKSTIDGLIIYNILIFYLLSAGNSFLASKILDEMEEKKVVFNEVTYNFLVYGFLQCNDLSRSVQFLTTMIWKGLRPSNRSLGMVISSLCNVGDLQKALELSREMESRGWTHGSVIQNAITEGLLSHGKIQEAEKFLDRMEERSLIPNNINYNNLIKQFCRYGRLYKAADLMNIMLKKHNVPSSTSYDSVIYGFCAQNKLDIALDFYYEMSIRSLNPSVGTFEMLVHSFCQAGRTEQAEQFLVDMTGSSETPTRKMYCSVINSYRTKNNLRKVSELMKAMQQKGYEPDFETQWSLISNLSNEKAKDSDNGSKGFLSRLLSKCGFPQKK